MKQRGSAMKIVATLPPMHPSEMLHEEFLKPMEITPYRVAKAAKFFGTTAAFWMNLQARYDIRTAERAIASDLEAIETFKQMVA